MGFLDKMKDTATKGAEKAKQGVQAGQDKLEDTRLRKKIETAKLEIGGLVYGQHTGTASAGADAEIDRLVTEIQATEEELAAGE